MSFKTHRLFIGYSTHDSAQVDTIAQHLRLLKHTDGTPRYLPWQDKHDLTVGVPNWWDAILNAIEHSDLFVFHLTLNSLKSEVCRAELEYAYQLNLPIILLVLNGSYDVIDLSASPRLHDEAEALLPAWSKRTQRLFYMGAAEFSTRFQKAVEYYEQDWPDRTPANRPLDPYRDNTYDTPHDMYEEACDRAYKLDFKASADLFRELVRRKFSDYTEIAKQWLELLQRYEELIVIDSRPMTRLSFFEEKWGAYRTLFPKRFLAKDEIFDPKRFEKRDEPKTHLPPSIDLPDVVNPFKEPVPRSAPPDPPPPPPTVVKPRSQDLLPAPFAWIEILGKGYSIAKYPVTNAQYAVFINEGGYQERKWWTEHGWQVQEEKKWTEPRYWQESRWNKGDHPVVGVSWYEAIAFCQWLSEKTGEKIMLPTEAQWQYAAQGDDGRAYPWGNDWDCKRCNNSVGECDSKATTPVRMYEGKGESPFGVVDMAGNIWEWCLTTYENNLNDINGIATRVLRGGAWDFDDANYFRCVFRDWNFPHNGNYGWGFRLSRSFLSPDF
ncbi:MAG: SUMF1/EgtB/PvdO family nonheme iron enzyme [Anaerolineae bacterium]|nr:SUMF1/EgtB/PvdO family nonheme iron enzyme [Anaerolineae bacterium]